MATSSPLGNLTVDDAQFLDERVTHELGTLVIFFVVVAGVVVVVAR